MVWKMAAARAVEGGVKWRRHSDPCKHPMTIASIAGPQITCRSAVVCCRASPAFACSRHCVRHELQGEAVLQPLL